MNRGFSPLHLRMGTDPVLKSSVPFGILDTGHKPKEIVILSVMQYYENPLKLKYLSIRSPPFFLLSSHYKVLKKRNEQCCSHWKPPPSSSVPLVSRCVWCMCFVHMSEVIHILTPADQQVMNCALNSAESSCCRP